MNMSDQKLLNRVDAIDRSDWATKTISLIKDAPKNWNSDAPFSINSPTDDKCINLLDIYLIIEDPTEYLFAKRVFGDYKKWAKIKNSAWGKKLFPAYAEELALKLKSKAVKGVIDIAEDIETKETTKLQALKFIISGGWGDKPSKAEQVSEKKDVSTRVDADLKRIGLRAVK